MTKRGIPVAVLAPLTESSTPLERLVSSGRASRPEADLLELLPPRGRPSTRLSDALRQERADRL